MTRAIQLRDGRAGCIRDVGPDDYERVRQYFAGLSDASRVTFCPHPFDDEHARFICETNDGQINVRVAATVGEGEAERIVGYCYCAGADTREYPTVGLGIIDEFHAQGLGQHLLRAVSEAAQARGEPGLELTVHKTNSPALHCYCKEGYRITGETADRSGRPGTAGGTERRTVGDLTLATLTGHGASLPSQYAAGSRKLRTLHRRRSLA